MKAIITSVISMSLMMTLSYGNASENLELLILHNNDMHSRFSQIAADSTTCWNPSTMRCYGGFARTAHVIKSYRALQEKGGRQVLFLNAGDTYQGSTWFTAHQDKIAVDLLNRLKPNVTSFGNHEFDLGVEGVLRYVQGVQFPIVAANLDFTLEPELAAMNIPQSVVLEVQGHKVGVIGYLTQSTQRMGPTGNVIFSHEVEALRKESEKLSKEGVKIIIALGHSGYLRDMEIAKEVPLVDLVVGGHTNTFLWNGDRPDLEHVKGPYPTMIVQPSGKKVPVVQAFAHTKYMGRLNVTFNPNGDLIEYGGNPLLLDSRIPEDPEMLALLKKYEQKVNDLHSTVVGTSRVRLDTVEHNCYIGECNMGNMLADAMVAYHAHHHKGHHWTDVPIAIVNAGTMRGSVDKLNAEGNVTRDDLMKMVPFQMMVGSLHLLGSDLLDVLEKSVWSDVEIERGDFLQVAGLHVVYDLRRPQGHRVVSVKARCSHCEVPMYEPLNLDARYGIMLNAYIGRGNGPFTIFKGAFRRKMEDKVDVDILAWYLEKMSPAAPELDGRIVVLGHDLPERSSASRCYTNIAFSISLGILAIKMLL